MNFFTVREISKEFDLEILRFFILSAHYRKPINFGRELIIQAQNGLERLYNGKKNLEHLMGACKDEELHITENADLETIEQLKEKFIDSMEDDINTADAISALFEIIKYTNSNLSTKTSKALVKRIYEILMELSNILGILVKQDEILDEEILNLIEQRNEARRNKDYKLSDDIRDNLKDKGIILEDSPEGVKWKRI